MRHGPSDKAVGVGLAWRIAFGLAAGAMAWCALAVPAGAAGDETLREIIRRVEKAVLEQLVARSHAHGSIHLPLEACPGDGGLEPR